MTHGGMGYAKEFHVERYLREILIARIAPVSPQLILCTSPSGCWACRNRIDPYSALHNDRAGKDREGA